MKEVRAEAALQALGMEGAAFDIMREKDGVSVYRVTDKTARYVLKIFANEFDCREIRNYGILQTLGVPTLTLHGQTENAVLLADIEAVPGLRLGCEADLSDRGIAQAAARWYRRLHEAGACFVRESDENFYDESDEITHANMQALMHATTDEANPFWVTLFARFNALRRAIDGLPRTLVYNDFYWTNLAVAEDKSYALMFDYNLLGKGYVYGDIRNVLSSLSAEAGRAFCEAYGEIDGTQSALDAVVSPLFTLHQAYRRDTFPSWAERARLDLKNGALLTKLQKALG